jgi:hypothetical protein
VAGRWGRRRCRYIDGARGSASTRRHFARNALLCNPLLRAQPRQCCAFRGAECTLPVFFPSFAQRVPSLRSQRFFSRFLLAPPRVCPMPQAPPRVRCNIDPRDRNCHSVALESDGPSRTLPSSRPPSPAHSTQRGPLVAVPAKIAVGNSLCVCAVPCGSSGQPRARGRALAPHLLGCPGGLRGVGVVMDRTISSQSVGADVCEDTKKSPPGTPEAQRDAVDTEPPPQCQWRVSRDRGCESLSGGAGPAGGVRLGNTSCERVTRSRAKPLLTDSRDREGWVACRDEQGEKKRQGDARDPPIPPSLPSLFCCSCGRPIAAEGLSPNNDFDELVRSVHQYQGDIRAGRAVGAEVLRLRMNARFGHGWIEEATARSGMCKSALYALERLARCWSASDYELLLRRRGPCGARLYEGHLVLIARVTAQARRAELVERVLSEGLSVRSLKELVSPRRRTTSRQARRTRELGER